jgi:hypothetical protein
VKYHPELNHRRARPALSAGGIAVVLFGLVSMLHAADLPGPVTLDIPIPANRALPAWLAQPTIIGGAFSSLNLPISTPDNTASLLVTVYFQEKQGGFLRILWKNAQGTAEVLADNFYENIGMANQRSILISSSTITGDGTLTFLSSDPNSGISRLKLEWMETRDSLVSPEVQDLLVTSANGDTQPAGSLTGQAATPVQGAWQDQLVTVPMTDAPVRIEQGVDFSVDLDKVPVTARIGLEESGLPMGKRLVVWINEQRAGTITPSVPDLLDAGYAVNASASASYIGWRNASFYPPVALLKDGVNSVQFSTEDDASAASPNMTAPTSGEDAPLAIKSLVMQLNYTPAPMPATAPAISDAVPQLLVPTDPTLRPDAP